MKRNNRYRGVYAVLLAAALILTGCGRNEVEPKTGKDIARTRMIFSMDTVMNLTVYGDDADGALDGAEKELYRLDALLARGKEDSAVFSLNRTGSGDDETLALLLDESAAVFRESGGAFDVTLAPVLELWGFGSGAEEHRVPAEDALRAALVLTGMEHIHRDGKTTTLDEGTKVDLGGVAKGYAGERLREIMREHGIENAVMDLGGDVALLGGKPGGSDWRVAVRDPDGDSFIGILEARDCFVMTSGVYERYFEADGRRYHHIIDPATGYPAQTDLISATVVCENGIRADALATAACVLGSEAAFAMRQRLRETLPFELILVTQDGRVLFSGGLAERFAPDSESRYRFERVSERTEEGFGNG